MLAQFRHDSVTLGRSTYARIFLHRDVHGIVLSGTIDGLVDELIAAITNDSTDAISDRTEYSQVFLLTHCTFISVEVLVETLWEKFQAAQAGNDTQQASRWDHCSFFSHSVLTTRVNRIISVMRYWLAFPEARLNTEILQQMASHASQSPLQYTEELLMDIKRVRTTLLVSVFQILGLALA